METLTEEQIHIGFNVRKNQTLLGVCSTTGRVSLLIASDTTKLSNNRLKVNSVTGIGTYDMHGLDLAHSLKRVYTKLEPPETFEKFLKENLTYTHDNEPRVILEYKWFIIKKHNLEDISANLKILDKSIETILKSINVNTNANKQHS